VASAALTVLGLIGAVLMAVEAAGLYQLQPLEREDMWLGLRVGWPGGVTPGLPQNGA
jgi:hypothetical protein